MGNIKLVLILFTKNIETFAVIPIFIKIKNFDHILLTLTWYFPLHKALDFTPDLSRFIYLRGRTMHCRSPFAGSSYT